MVHLHFKPILFKNLKLSYIFCSASFKTLRPTRKERLHRPDVIESDKDVVDGLESNVLKHRSHPGLVGHRAVRPPVKFEVSLLNSSTDIVIEMLKKPAVELYNYLEHRSLPFSESYLRAKKEEIRREILENLIGQRREEKDGQTDDEIEEFAASQNLAIERTLKKKMKSLAYRWCEIDYGSLAKCLTYALARFSPDYAILRRILGEIRKRDVNFRPKNVFDFGSGVGSTIWAVDDTWKNSVEEYYCVDTCTSMNDLLTLLIHNGDINGPKLFPANIYTRQFLPAASDRKYDIVVSAFSLMEIPSYEERMRIIANLWEKTEKYLVLVENGNRYGFITVLESRDYILAGGREVWRKQVDKFLADNKIDPSSVQPILESKDLTERQKYVALSEKFGKDVKIPTLVPEGFVYAPCPHDVGCPKLADVLPCKFYQQHYPLQLMSSQQEIKREKFSYVVLKKGNRNDDDAHAKWPRVLQNLVQTKHNYVRCDLCTANGLLEEINVTRQKHGRHLFRMVSECDSGDLLPIRTSFVDKEVQGSATTVDEKFNEEVDGEDNENEFEMKESYRK